MVLRQFLVRDDQMRPEPMPRPDRAAARVAMRIGKLDTRDRLLPGELFDAGQEASAQTAAAKRRRDIEIDDVEVSSWREQRLPVFQPAGRIGGQPAAGFGNPSENSPATQFGMPQFGQRRTRQPRLVDRFVHRHFGGARKPEVGNRRRVLGDGGPDHR